MAPTTCQMRMPDDNALIYFQEHQEDLEENGSRSSTPVSGKMALGASTPVMRGGGGFLQHPFQEKRPADTQSDA